MGHGDELVICDVNHPAQDDRQTNDIRQARRRVRMRSRPCRRSHPVAIPARHFRRSSGQAYAGSRRQRKIDAHILDDPIGGRRRTW
ncbi:hypothetical protein [Rhizobium etli]|uniref:hypothetical protein n=1 Tax=Rhizobium etli TaxID=29449 RepID=UPI002473DA1C|nr:hypothetical protein [Rhizobium etli]